jgi:hypothetical protein
VTQKSTSLSIAYAKPNKTNHLSNIIIIVNPGINLIQSTLSMQCHYTITTLIHATFLASIPFNQIKPRAQVPQTPLAKLGLIKPTSNDYEKEMERLQKKLTLPTNVVFIKMRQFHSLNF